MTTSQTPEDALPRGRPTSRLLLRLFPRPWRERYADEFAALLDDVGLTPGALFDVLVAALDARLHAHHPAWRWPPMADRLRRLELLIFASWVAFVVAGSAFAKMTEDPPLSLLANDALHRDPASFILVIAAVASLAGILIAGVPIAIAIATDALRRRRWSQLALLATPAVACVGWLGVTLVVSKIEFSIYDDLPRLAAFLVWAGAGLIGVVASCIALSVAAMNAKVDARHYLRAVVPAFLAAAGMVGGTIAVVGWGVALFVSDPYHFWAFAGLLATSTWLSWLAIAATMVVASAVAVRAAIRLRRREV